MPIKKEIRAIIADHFGVDLADVKFGMGICANVFNAKEKRHDDTGRVSQAVLRLGQRC